MNNNVNFGIRSNVESFKELFKFILPYRKAAILSTIFVSLIVVLSMGPPLLYKAIVDKGINGGSFQQIAIYSSYIAIIICVIALLQIVEEYFSCQFSLVMMNDIRNRLYHHLQSLPIEFFHTVSPGAILSRFTTDLLNLQKVVARTLPSVLTNALMILVSFSIMMYLSWRLTIVTVIAIPIYCVAAWKISKIVSKIASNAMRMGDKMMSTLNEDFNYEGVLFSRLSGIELHRKLSFELQTSQIQSMRLQLGLWARGNGILVDLVQSVSILLIYYIGGISVIDSTLTIGAVIAFAAFATRLYQPIVFFSTTVIDLPNAILSMDRINQFFNVKPSRSPSVQRSEIKPTPFSHIPVIHLCNVTYKFVDKKENAISGISLDVYAGERIAIVGANGAGKTTLLLLLAGIYKSSSGTIKICDIPIDELNSTERAKYLGVGLGNSFFFNASVKENMLIVCPSADDSAITNALLMAECDFLLREKNFLDISLGQNGMKLSAGQRQRVGLARLFLQNSIIICFDETTANVDPQSEDTLTDAIFASAILSTIVLVTHSMKTARKADRILVLDKGVLIGDGSHSHLVTNCKEYRKLLGADRNPALITEKI